MILTHLPHIDIDPDAVDIDAFSWTSFSTDDSPDTIVVGYAIVKILTSPSPRESLKTPASFFLASLICHELVYILDH